MSKSVAYMDSAWERSPEQYPASHKTSLSRNSLPMTLFLLAMLAVGWHLYRAPEYAMDSLQYMGNALLMDHLDVREIHARVFAEVELRIPQPRRDQVLGLTNDGPRDQNESRYVRSHDPYRYAEFLPLFAIRPLYNQTLYWLSKTGLGLVRSGVVISVASYFGIGVLLFVWMRLYLQGWVAAIAAFLASLTPPMTMLGRETRPDALATLVALAALYLIVESKKLAAGFTLLLISIFIRTDFVVLAAPVLLVCCRQRQIKLWHGAVLSALALASVLFINHFAGDYGFQMLYYRNFIGTPIAPGEMTVRLAPLDYLTGMKHGVTLIFASFFFPFLLLGLPSLYGSIHARTLFQITLAYTLLHFAVLPNWEERWFGIFYLGMTVAAAINWGQRNASREPLVRTPSLPSSLKAAATF